MASAELATPPGGRPPGRAISGSHVARLEKDIDQWSAGVEPERTFVLPRGDAGTTELHVARTVARRAERAMWELHRTEPLRSELLVWSNRMSDLLFALALSINRSRGFVELPPDYAV